MKHTSSFLRRNRLGLWVALAVLGWTSVASANYPWRIPNGYSNRFSVGTGRCSVCHVDPVGGGVRTVFGTDFINNGYVWNRELAERDSDGDGYSNGQELGDPWGTWAAARALTSPPVSSPYAPGYPGPYYANPGTSSQPSESSYNTCSSSARNDCDANASCSRSSFNGIGDWDCTCRAGYRANSRQGHTRTNLHDFTQGVAGNDLYNILSFATGCVDINECSPNPCGPGSCAQTAPPGYTCSCSSGYRFNGATCVNINECTATPGICGVGTCSDRTGSYNCGCPTGYVFNGTTCVVDNACDAGTHDCDLPRATCTPFRGTSWNCTCISGYVGVGSASRGTGDSCRDIDECRAAPCGAGSCVNTPGSYSCACPRGYSFDGSSCADIDECVPDPCGVGGTRCTNSPGSFTCACRAGFTFDGSTCADIDECASRPCGMGSCVETDPPGYSCSCDSGYAEVGGTCVDIDECAPAVVVCSDDATCTNSAGSFRCECEEGYEGDGLSCIDIDECGSGTDDCHANATCTNMTGGYLCACVEGYRGSGSSCSDIDECAAGIHGCGLNEVCRNVLGSPNECPCRGGFERTDAGECVSSCGNGRITQGEVCDDGNVELGDGCDQECRIESGWACWEPTGAASECQYTCGDEWVDAPAEECDDGAANSDTEPGACRTDCVFAFCGDGVIDSGEMCDEGESNSDETADACRATCVPAFCGDGVVDSTELCDPGSGSALPNANCVRDCAMADAGPDGGVTPPVEGGCSCRSTGTDVSPVGGWLLLALAGWAFRRRRL